MEIIGYLGGFLLSANLLPQLYQSVTTKSSEDVSMLFLVLNESGLSLYMIYGFVKSVYALAFPAFVSLMLNTSLIIIKWKQHSQKQKLQTTSTTPSPAEPSEPSEAS